MNDILRINSFVSQCSLLCGVDYFRMGASLHRCNTASKPFLVIFLPPLGLLHHCALNTSHMFPRVDSCYTLATLGAICHFGGALLFHPEIHLLLELCRWLDHIGRKILAVEGVMWVVQQVLHNGGPVNDRITCR